MITVTIGGMSRRLDQVDAYWVHQQVDHRHHDDQPVCVRFAIDEPDAKMTLTTPACSTNGGGGRKPNAIEQEIFERWHRHRLDSAEFTGGNVISFIQQLERVL